MSGSLLLRRECCSFSNGEYLKAGLHELELWCLKATDQVTKYLEQPKEKVQETPFLRFFIFCIWFILQFAGSSWDELKHIRQAVGFLV